MSSTEPVVSVVAPPGYGKTTLLTQWAERVSPRVAWVTCERSDNDPVALWGSILSALDDVKAVPERSRALVSSIGRDVGAVPRVVAALGELEGPVLVVLDQLEVLTNPHALVSIFELAHRLPAGWRLAVASRDTMRSMARLRVEGRVLELGPTDLAMATAEAAELLRLA